MQDSQTKLGTEEGADCGDNGCTGTLVFVSYHACTCHINPPCPACEESFLACTKCSREHQPDD